MQENNNIEMVASAIVKRGDKYLLVQRLNPPSKDMYAFPGGRSEKGETPEQTALRELEEETGLIGSHAKLYRDYVEQTEGYHFHLHVCKVDVHEFTNLRAMDDAKSLGWFTIKETQNLKMPENMIDCFRHLAKDQTWQIDQAIVKIVS